ncbi:MAG: GTPase HflX [Treponema sp.]|jgi:GTP-binding protein HflX|nr:GTPase HflX [Treponema sp.]
MGKMYDTREPAKRAFLVTIYEKNEKSDVSLQNELASLCHTLELEITGEEAVHIREYTARFGMGIGKAAEIAEKVKAIHADCVIFGNILNPPRQRNWEELTGVSVMDRQELIVRIFAERAQSREAKLQVELARLEYSLPRLQHKYIDLSRQRGGRYGTKGSGETKSETDRRIVEQRIRKLKEDLDQVRKMRETQRKMRRRQSVPVCALVGYTNAGKSSLLNALTNADVFVEDKLFATLDATTRKLSIDEKTILITDTVGFIRNLPHALVNAFHSTLEEAALADLLIHVLDASDANIDRYYETTLSVLRELSAEAIPIITVLNKTDCLSLEVLADLQRRYPDALSISTTVGSGINVLKSFLIGSLC